MRSNIKSTQPHRTPLDDWHRQHGGHMVPFGDYEMPLWYDTGTKAEHIAVLQSAGLFDTCHMSVITLSGKTAINLLQRYFSRDLLSCDRGVPLTPGRGTYGVFLKENGHLIDDAIIFQIDVASYIICVNSGNGEKVVRHLQQQSDPACTIIDLTGKVAKFDLQGQASPAILRKIIRNFDHIFASFPFLTCCGHFQPDSPHAKEVLLDNGTPILLSRSGYTGELGFELFIAPDMAPFLWNSLMDAGDIAIKACGLAARDSLRTSAVLPLAGHDIGDRPFLNNPWQFALPFVKKPNTFSKQFLGSQALAEMKNCPHTYPFVGFDLRKIEPGPDAGLYDENDQKIGTILTCVSDMTLARIDGVVCSINSPDLPKEFAPTGLCCGFVLVDHPLPYGQIVFLHDKRRKLRVEIVADIRPHKTQTKKFDFIAQGST